MQSTSNSTTVSHSVTSMILLSPLLLLMIQAHLGIFLLSGCAMQDCPQLLLKGNHRWWPFLLKIFLFNQIYIWHNLCWDNFMSTNSIEFSRIHCTEGYARGHCKCDINKNVSTKKATNYVFFKCTNFAILFTVGAIIIWSRADFVGLPTYKEWNCV